MFGGGNGKTRGRRRGISIDGRMEALDTAEDEEPALLYTLGKVRPFHDSFISSVFFPLRMIKNVYNALKYSLYLIVFACLFFIYSFTSKQLDKTSFIRFLLYF